VLERHATEDEAPGDSEGAVVGHRPVVHDDGAAMESTSDTWARPWSEVSPTTPPVVAPTVTLRRSFTWGQALVALAGLASLVFGIGAVALAGLAGSVTAPVVEVFTYDHTPLLGLIEIGAGAVLVLAALVPGGRWIAGPVGVAAIVGGALIVAELDWIQSKLAAQQRFGWVAIGIGAVAYLGAMVPAKKRVVAARQPLHS
jgi:hypothetical protein